jgi:hypothetical protein
MSIHICEDNLDTALTISDIAAGVIWFVIFIISGM